MRRIVVQVCAAVAWIAIIVPSAFSQAISFSVSDGNGLYVHRNCQEPSSGDRGFCAGMGSVSFFPKTVGRDTCGLPENLLRSKGENLFGGTSLKGMKTSYAIDPHTFSVVVSDTRYISSLAPAPGEACLVIDGLADAGQSGASPYSEPIFMLLGGIGLIGLSGAKKLKKPSSLPVIKKDPLVVSLGNSYQARSRLRQQFESRAA